MKSIGGTHRRDRTGRRRGLGLLAMLALLGASAASLAGGCSGRSVTLPTNQPPTVAASGSPLNGNPPLTVAFSASPSDPDGRIVSLVWNFKDGTTSTEQNPVHTFNTIGLYDASVTVRDEWNAVDSGQVSVNVSANNRPTADAGPDQSNKDPGSGIGLNGTGSSDPDGGQSITYSWSQIGGSSVSLSNPTTATPSFTTFSSTAETYTFRLTVTDNGNPRLSGTDDVSVTTRWTWNNLASGIIAAGANRRCAVPGCHDGSNSSRVTLNTYAQVTGVSSTIRSKVSPGGTMRGYCAGNEADHLIQWIDSGTPLTN